MLGSVVIADGDDLSRIGLRTLLSNAGIDAIYSEVGNFTQLMQTLDQGSEGIAIVDVKLEGLTDGDAPSALEGLGEVLTRFPRYKICVLVDSVTRDTVARYLALGVLGCVERSRSANEIEQAIKTIADDRPYLSKLADNDDAPAMPARTPGDLTHQQRKVLSIMANGKSNKEIARELGICEGTVKVHINAAYRTLGVHNRVAAVTVLREAG